jgi:integrase
MTPPGRAPSPDFSSPVASVLQRFLEFKRAAGCRYHEEARALGVLDRFLGQHLTPGDPVISLDVLRAYMARRDQESETTRANRVSLIRQVCRFLALEQPRTAIPGPRFLGICRRPFVPRVLTREEGRRFLRVRNTKFGKSRLVPVARDVASRLRHCHAAVGRQVGLRAPTAPFFPAPAGGRYSVSALRAAFHDVLASADIPRWSGGRSLRLHDTRHSFAVLRLVLWCQQDADLGARLPALATYLGHVGLSSSQRYLQVTPDLVGEITRRHAARFGYLITDGRPS